MKIIREAEKNPDTGGLEITIRFTADEIDYLNGCIRMYIQKQKGDIDDSKQEKLQEQVKEGFHQARNKVKP